jgi:hypothetical protein
LLFERRTTVKKKVNGQKKGNQKQVTATTQSPTKKNESDTIAEEKKDRS